MNKKRKNDVNTAIEYIKNASSDLVTAQEILDRVTDQEQDALDNTPESFQETDRYYDSENAIEVLESAVDSLSDVVSDLNDIID